MRIGLFIGGTPVPWDLAGHVDAVVRAEADGFDGCWLAHIAGADALTVLALAGARTARIELGTAVVPIYPRHPTALAQQALTVNAAAGGGSRSASGRRITWRSSASGCATRASPATCGSTCPSCAPLSTRGAWTSPAPP